MSQCFFLDFHAVCNLIGSKFYSKDCFHMILDVIPPDQCNISHHAEQNQLENSRGAVCCSCSEFRETLRHSSASSSANAPQIDLLFLVLPSLQITSSEIALTLFAYAQCWSNIRILSHTEHHEIKTSLRIRECAEHAMSFHNELWQGNKITCLILLNLGGLKRGSKWSLCYFAQWKLHYFIMFSY